MSGRIYQNFKEMYSETLRSLQEFGVVRHKQSSQNQIGDFKIKEIQGESFTVLNHHDMYELLEEVAPGIRDWVEGEFKERISPEYLNPGEAYKLRRNIWDEFLNDGEDGKFGYTYNERMRYQLEDTIELLKRDPDSTQAVITLYEGQTDTKRRGGHNRVPCSMHYQFFVNRTEDLSTGKVGKRVDIIYSIRSNDFGKFFVTDLIFAAKLQEYVAERLSTEDEKVDGNGKLIYQGGSLHYYVDRFEHVM